MKLFKYITMIALIPLLLLPGTLPPSTNATASTIQIIMDGKPLTFDVEPFILNGSTMVPMRAIFEAFGTTVEWNNNTRTVTANSTGIALSYVVGASAAYQNGERFTFPSTPGWIINDRTMMRLRFVGEFLGATVHYDQAKHTIFIYSQSGATQPTASEATEREKRQRLAIEAVYFPTVYELENVISQNWVLFPKVAQYGDVVMVRHRQPADISFNGKTYTLQPFGSGYYTYLPIPLQVVPGTYEIGDQQLTVRSKEFPTQYLQVSQRLQLIRQDTAKIQADQAKINRARSSSFPEFLFTSSFMLPVIGRETTPYGHTRYINGKYASSHMAIDWAAPTGTPVRATNNGIVALADDFHLTGYSIYLDHGMNLFSQYSHLSKLLVENGQVVQKGDVIGLVGSTGFSTGPHLHFAFWSHGVPVNPNQFIGKLPFEW